MGQRDDPLQFIEEELVALKSKSLFSTPPVLASPTSGNVEIGGKSFLNFSSNNYLGLSNHPRLRQAAKDAIDKYGISPSAVRTISGTHILHKQLEEELAKFKKAEAVVVFQSGFSANIATIPALVSEGDTIFSDELNHASIIDGARLSKANVIRFKHKDTKDLENKIKENSDYRRGIVITDGVFSMDGDIAPLPEIVRVARKFGLMSMVDDAHGEGVLGEGGRGIVDHFQLHGQVDVEVGTMSKAFGAVGGMVAGKQHLIDWLKQRGRSYLFSSAMTFPDTAACLQAVIILSEDNTLVKKLWDNGDYLRKSLKELGFDTGKSETPIIPIIVGEEARAQEFSKRLFEQGLFAKAIVYPTVAQGAARLRVMSSASHTEDDLKKAVGIFEKVGKELKIV